MPNTVIRKFHITISSSHEQKLETDPILVNNIHGLDSLLKGINEQAFLRGVHSPLRRDTDKWGPVNRTARERSCLGGTGNS